MSNHVVDPAQLERLRAVTGCMQDPNFTCRHYRAVDDAPDCDACLALLAAAVEEQTIARCAADLAIPELWSDDPVYVLARREAAMGLRSLPRQWGSTPKEAR